MKTIVYFENGETDIVKHLEGGSVLVLGQRDYLNKVLKQCVIETVLLLISEGYRAIFEGI